MYSSSRSRIESGSGRARTLSRGFTATTPFTAPSTSSLETHCLTRPALSSTSPTQSRTTRWSPGLPPQNTSLLCLAAVLPCSSSNTPTRAPSRTRGLSVIRPRCDSDIGDATTWQEPRVPLVACGRPLVRSLLRAGDCARVSATGVARRALAILAATRAADAAAVICAGENGAPFHPLSPSASQVSLPGVALFLFLDRPPRSVSHDSGSGNCRITCEMPHQEVHRCRIERTSRISKGYSRGASG